MNAVVERCDEAPLYAILYGTEECTDELAAEALCKADCMDATSCEVMAGDGSQEESEAYVLCLDEC